MCTPFTDMFVSHNQWAGRLRFFVILIVTVVLVCAVAAGARADYKKDYIGEEKIYIAGQDDTLVKVARAFSLGFVELRAANPYADPWVLEEGSEVILPSWHLLPNATKEGVVINLPEMRLYYYKKEGGEPVTFPLGIGREGLETPMGMTKVVRKKVGPQWRPTPRMRREDPTLPAVVEAGPDNPLGTHALYLGWPSYAMHGTNKPYGIGRRISSGCIRLYPENIVSLYEMVPVGTPVQVVNQPIKLAWIDDVLYMEAHPELDQAIQMEESGQIFTAKVRDEDLQKIIEFAGDQQDRLHWSAIRLAIRERSGRPIMIARRRGGSMKDKNLDVVREFPAEVAAIFDQENAQN